MKILAIIQNQWFKDAKTVRRIMENNDRKPLDDRMKFRAIFIKRMLFHSCRSGRILRSYLTEQVCEQIIWDEASKEIGDKPSHCPKADRKHIEAVISYYRPDAVIAFGNIAGEGLCAVMAFGGELPCNYTYILAPHPACRAPKDHATLKAACQRIREIIANA